MLNAGSMLWSSVKSVQVKINLCSEPTGTWQSKSQENINSSSIPYLGVTMSYSTYPKNNMKLPPKFLKKDSKIESSVDTSPQVFQKAEGPLRRAQQATSLRAWRARGLSRSLHRGGHENWLRQPSLGDLPDLLDLYVFFQTLLIYGFRTSIVLLYTFQDVLGPIFEQSYPLDETSWGFLRDLGSSLIF